MRPVILLFICAIAGTGAYLGEPLVRDNSDAITILITVFTVFAGFLVAIITIVGDPALIPGGSWRIAEARRDDIESRLLRQMWLFVLYLIAIVLLFVGVLLREAAVETVSLAIKVWIARAYLFFGFLSFIITFALPASLIELQRARIDAEIARRRNEVGLKD
jgi:uncharacterized membrane protein